jgi:hypothetical protein
VLVVAGSAFVVVAVPATAAVGRIATLVLTVGGTEEGAGP